MNEDDRNSISKPQRRYFLTFSLSSLLIATTLIALATLYISYRRERGNDVLHRTLAEIAVVSILDTPVEKATWIDRLLGNSDQEIVGKTLKFDSRVLRHEVKIDRSSASRLAKNSCVGGVRQLVFRNVTVDSDAVCFFENWNHVNSIQIRDTALPKSWADKFKRMKGLKELIISGGLCSLEPESLAGCQSLEKLTLCHRNIDSTRLQELTKLLPGVKILLLGSMDQPYPYPKNSTALSAHDERVYTKLKKSLDQLQQALNSLDPPAKNRFHGPATEAEIIHYEQELGAPLHPSVRALFEIYNGQPSPYDELVTFEKLLTIEESIGNMQMEADVDSWYNFDPEYDWMDNPNLIAIGSSEADVLYVNNVSGKVYYAYEGLTYVFPTLENYFDAITEEVNARRLERNEHDCICLTEHTTTIGKKWLKRQKEIDSAAKSKVATDK